MMRCSQIFFRMSLVKGIRCTVDVGRGGRVEVGSGRAELLTCLQALAAWLPRCTTPTLTLLCLPHHSHYIPLVNVLVYVSRSLSNLFGILRIKKALSR